VSIFGSGSEQQASDEKGKRYVQQQQQENKLHIVDAGLMVLLLTTVSHDGDRVLSGPTERFLKLTSNPPFELFNYCRRLLLQYLFGSCIAYFMLWLKKQMRYNVKARNGRMDLPTVPARTFLNFTDFVLGDLVDD
jgi:hypothetical protein